MANEAAPSSPQPSSPAQQIQPLEAQALPPLLPPETKSPFQVNQQVNFYQQIPPGAWDRLSPTQVYDLTKEMIKTADVIDKRHFDYAMSTTAKRSGIDTLSIIVGGVIACLGIGGAIYLAMTGHEMIALSISLPLATILAVVVGRKLR